MAAAEAASLVDVSLTVSSARSAADARIVRIAFCAQISQTMRVLSDEAVTAVHECLAPSDA